MGRIEERVFSGWLVIRRAPDLPDQWVAHCLDYDVVTQGNSLGDAICMAKEAVGMVLSDDLSHHRDPYQRRAPQHYWDELYEGVGRAKHYHGEIGKLDEKAIETFFCQIAVHCFRTCEDGEDREGEAARVSIPIIWTKKDGESPASAPPVSYA